MNFGDCLLQVRRTAPLVHAVTNYVTAGAVADLLTAAGARPVMADDPREAPEITARAAGLCLNLGTPHQETLRTMLTSGEQAARLGRPILLDPVGIGGSGHRAHMARRLLSTLPLTAIRGNITEIKALVSPAAREEGVDASPRDAVGEGQTGQAMEQLAGLARQLGAILAATGAIDLVTDGSRGYIIRNGHPRMGRLSGTGCQLSALMTAFLAACPDAPLEAAAAAVCMMGLAGEAAAGRLRPGEGIMTYRIYLMDAIDTMTAEQLEEGANIETWTRTASPICTD